MPTKLEAWLARTVEDAIEPDLPICDPHHHFWHSREGHDPLWFLNIRSIRKTMSWEHVPSRHLDHLSKLRRLHRSGLRTVHRQR
jgi:hypothetical protein